MRIPFRSTLELAAIVGIVLLLALLVAGSWRPFRVTGMSMHPALHPGDVVMVRLRERSMGVGDIILFTSPGHGPVLHRAIHVDRAGNVRTQGDSNAIADRSAVASKDVLGPVRTVIPVGRFIMRWRGADACATMKVQSNSTK